ncbi:hypothetical protein [uncultured Nocardioides sp.]|uniref:hypothetical protein n=1 Tax=uncultured Nocardioides sp. TaxID=198441 RepID=UPI0026357C20|nr:hypothetical protein [uncultured Nocardioides sp.]
MTEDRRLRLRDLETTRRDLTPLEQGELRTFLRYGTPADAERARRRLDQASGAEQQARKIAADAVTDLFDRYDGRRTR